jgi:hypothetical protein
MFQSMASLQPQPFYLEAADAEDLERLVSQAGKSKQTLLREAVTDLLAKYRAQGFLKPTSENTDEFQIAQLRRELEREIRTGAAIDVDALVAAGDLVKKRRNWYVVRDPSVLGKVSQLVGEVSTATVRGQSEIRVRLHPVTKWKRLAAKLGPSKG